MWSLTSLQWAAIKPHVQGKVVHDLGAYDLSLSHALLEEGAERVVAIDRLIAFQEKDDRIQFIQTLFHNYRGKIDVAVISWPVNWPCGLEAIAQRARKVVYIGNNFDGLACGDGHLWDHLRQREVLAHVPNQANTLIIYGKVDGRPRPVLPEERAGVDDREILRYEDHYANLQA